MGFRRQYGNVFQNSGAGWGGWVVAYQMELFAPTEYLFLNDAIIMICCKLMSHGEWPWKDHLYYSSLVADV